VVDFTTAIAGHASHQIQALGKSDQLQIETAAEVIASAFAQATSLFSETREVGYWSASPADGRDHGTHFFATRRYGIRSGAGALAVQHYFESS
jgi:hypothetical protein